MNKGIDITGQRFGNLVAVRLIPIEERKNAYKRREWECLCDCGTVFIAEQRNILSKYREGTKSCGCLREKRHFLATNALGLEEEWINQFTNFSRYRLIHSLLYRTVKSLHQYELNDYKETIEFLYHNEQAHAIFDFWEAQEKRGQTFYDWAKPSLDHIIPVSRGGGHNKENLQILTVFENLSKRDMTREEWENFKNLTNTTSDYFIENILSKQKGR